MSDARVPCAYVCRNLRLMRKHCTQRHRWVNQQKRGGDVCTKLLHTENKIWTRDHACQQFFKVNSWQKYFEVAHQHTTASLERQRSLKTDFFREQANDIQQAERDATEDAKRVHRFDDHVSTVVP